MGLYSLETECRKIRPNVDGATEAGSEIHKVAGNQRVC